MGPKVVKAPSANCNDPFWICCVFLGVQWRHWELCVCGHYLEKVPRKLKWRNSTPTDTLRVQVRTLLFCSWHYGLLLKIVCDVIWICGNGGMRNFRLLSEFWLSCQVKKCLLLSFSIYEVIMLCDLHLRCRGYCSSSLNSKGHQMIEMTSFQQPD